MNKWDRRYQFSRSPGEACWVLQEHQHLLPDSGRALDLACGLGANALLLAQRGLDTQAWDASTVALKKLNEFADAAALAVTTELRDVEREPPAANSFEVIVVSQFLYRPLFAPLVQALVPGGLLFYQTWHQHKCSERGPSNPDYLLAPGELLLHFSELQTVFYREDGRFGDLEEGLRDISYYIGARAMDSGSA